MRVMVVMAVPVMVTVTDASDKGVGGSGGG